MDINVTFIWLGRNISSRYAVINDTELEGDREMERKNEWKSDEMTNKLGLSSDKLRAQLNTDQS